MKKEQKIIATQEAIHRKMVELKQLQNTLVQLRRCQPLKVSDHAVVRYLERVEVIPVDQVWEKLITPQILVWYHQLGDGTYPLHADSNIRVVIKEATIVTVIA